MDAAFRLGQELASLPVVRAYLFGSQATGEAGPLSDVDVAILPDEHVQGVDRLLLQGKISAIAAALFNKEHADVILLDEAPPGIAFTALKGRILLDRDEPTRPEFEARLMAAYYDRRHYEDRWNRVLLDRFRGREAA